MKQKHYILKTFKQINIKQGNSFAETINLKILTTEHGCFVTDHICHTGSTTMLVLICTFVTDQKRDRCVLQTMSHIRHIEQTVERTVKSF